MTDGASGIWVLFSVFRGWGGNVSCLCGLRGCGTGWNALLFDGWYISLNVVKYI